MEEQVKKKKVLSLIQPSGTPTLGNYLGALKNWSDIAEEYDCAFGVADLHAITVRQDPVKFREQIRNMYALMIAIGLDPEKSILFVQSQVPTHAQLAWILDCYTQFGENFDMDLLANTNANGNIINRINYAGANFRIVLKGEPAYGGKYLYTVDRESVRVEGRKVTLSTYADIDREFEDGGEHEISF